MHTVLITNDVNYGYNLPVVMDGCCLGGVRTQRKVRWCLSRKHRSRGLKRRAFLGHLWWGHRRAWDRHTCRASILPPCCGVQTWPEKKIITCCFVTWPYILWFTILPLWELMLITLIAIDQLMACAISYEVIARKNILLCCIFPK